MLGPPPTAPAPVRRLISSSVQRWHRIAVPAVALLAPMLGGTSELWAQAALPVATGLLLLALPTQRSPGLTYHFCAGALLLIALSGFLPASWFAAPEWRMQLGQLGAALLPTRSVQPWLTLESCCLLFAGLGWVFFLFGRKWTPSGREMAVRVFCAGILALAAMLIVARALGEHVPFWPAAPDFGFFPNRNQTSNVLALGGVMIYAVGVRGWQRRERLWWAWLAALSVVCSALVVNYSRAGILLLFLGIAAWQTWNVARWRKLHAAAAGVATLALLVGVMLTIGRETLARFDGGAASVLTGDARLHIYRDCLALVQQQPLLGIGLGNFPAVFPFYRQASVALNDLIHPESDWLWSAAEMGWLAPLLLLLLFAWWFARTWPFEAGTDRDVRCAAAICGCAFAVHGLVDVSGHRLGAFWPAAFLASIALHPGGATRASAGTKLASRAIGLALVTLGGWWFASILRLPVPPTRAERDRLMQAAESAVAASDPAGALRDTNAGLRIAPLEWSFYFNRAVAEVQNPSDDYADARRDFALVRYLTPHWAEVCLQEGAVWMAAGEPDLAFNAWAEALRRAAPDQVSDIYGQMFEHLDSNAALVDRWRELGRVCDRCLVPFLEHASPLEVDLELRRVAADDPEFRAFTPAETKRLLKLWYLKGDKDWLAGEIQSRRGWLAIGWPWLARIEGERGDYREASALVQRFAPAPVIPRSRGSDDLESLQYRFRADRRDLANGFELYQAQLRAGRVDEALATLQTLATKPHAPAWIAYLQAQLWVEKSDWKQAWDAFQNSGVLPDS